MPLESVNDFVIRFANVNGSGSASANQLFAHAILRMGVPVAPRNIFPSNIQGLPTWYEVRVSAAGHLGARGGVDLMVAMNPQTWDKDVASIEPGGYLFYDSTRPVPKSRFRDDISVIGMPLTEICNRRYSDSRQRQLFKNIMYVGALTALLDMDVKAAEKLISEEFKGKDKLIAPNLEALQVGRDYAREHLACPIGLRIKRADAVGDRIYIEGNSAAALGAVYGGATVCAWYPITPSSSLAEAFTRHCARYRVDPKTGKHRYAVVQAEDELASLGIVVGAAWNGARAFTATSGPGISLMQEFLGLAYFAEIPAVIFDVQRGSPSTGMPTKTQQADILSAAYASHGDTKHVLLFPEDPTECFEMGSLAFDLAERLQTPVFVMLELDIGMQDWLTAPFQWDDTRKLETAKEFVPKPVIAKAGKPTRAGVIWFGSSGAPIAESLSALEQDGIYLDRMRIRAFPFHDSVVDFVAEHDHVFVVEQNRDAQLRMLLVNECGIAPDKLVPVLHYDGNPMTARFVSREIAEKAAVFNVTPLRKVAR